MRASQGEGRLHGNYPFGTLAQPYQKATGSDREVRDFMIIGDMKTVYLAENRRELPRDGHYSSSSKGYLVPISDAPSTETM